ncbi:hypothetical protein Ancab_000476 [Ancistrocladus abbreviatus]
MSQRPSIRHGSTDAAPYSTQPLFLLLVPAPLTAVTLLSSEASSPQLQAESSPELLHLRRQFASAINQPLLPACTAPTIMLEQLRNDMMSLWLEGDMRGVKLLLHLLV